MMLGPGLVILSVVLGFIPATVATRKGGNFLVWWIYGAVLFPFALIHALLMTVPPDVADARALATGQFRRCPHCAEIARVEATVCPHCRTAIAPEPPRPPAPGPIDEPLGASVMWGIVGFATIIVFVVMAAKAMR